MLCWRSVCYLNLITYIAQHEIWQFYAKYLISQSLICMYEAQVPDKVLLEQAIQRYMASPGPSKCYVTSNTWDLGDEVPDMVVVYFSGENQAFRSP